MNHVGTTNANTSAGFAAMDVFAAARWLNEQLNSTARAVSPDTVEWQCRTWGSGEGACAWEDSAVFAITAAAFDLETWANDEQRNELVVVIPLERFPQIAPLISRLDEASECWRWKYEDDHALQIELAAEDLAMTPQAVADNPALRQALDIA